MSRFQQTVVIDPQQSDLGDESKEDDVREPTIKDVPPKSIYGNNLKNISSYNKLRQGYKLNNQKTVFLNDIKAILKSKTCYEKVGELLNYSNYENSLDDEYELFNYNTNLKCESITYEEIKLKSKRKNNFVKSSNKKKEPLDLNHDDDLKLSKLSLNEFKQKNSNHNQIHTLINLPDNSANINDVASNK